MLAATLGSAHIWALDRLAVLGGDELGPQVLSCMTGGEAAAGTHLALGSRVEEYGALVDVVDGCVATTS